MKIFRLLLCLVVLLTVMEGRAGEKNDILVLKNGDRITGEIRKLEAGLLQFSTDTMGTVYVEWRFISEVYSDKNLSVEATDGTRLLGQMSKSEMDENLIVTTNNGPVELMPSQVVTVWPVAQTFLDKVDLNISVGIDYAKSTEIGNFNLAIDFSHRSDERLTEASLRSDVTRQSQGDEQNRQELRYSHQFLLHAQQFRILMGSAESNEALGVDLRMAAGGGLGKYFVKTNQTWFSALAGLMATQETPDQGDSETNLEAVGNLRYRYFHFAHPQRSLDATLSVFPSLTDWGRVRSDLRTTFRLEMVRDLYWAMELYATYDNETLSSTSENLDYGVTSSLGYSF